MGCNWVVVLVMCMMVASAVDHAQAAVSCAQVTNDVFPCIGFATNGNLPISPACCAAVNKLNNGAQTTPDRQATCNCLKSLTRSFSLKFAGDIPAACHINLPYKLDPSIDCTTVT